MENPTSIKFFLMIAAIVLLPGRKASYCICECVDSQNLFGSSDSTKYPLCRVANQIFKISFMSVLYKLIFVEEWIWLCNYIKITYIWNKYTCLCFAWLYISHSAAVSAIRSSSGGASASPPEDGLIAKTAIECNIYNHVKHSQVSFQLMNITVNAKIIRIMKKKKKKNTR